MLLDLLVCFCVYIGTHRTIECWFFVQAMCTLVLAMVRAPPVLCAEAESMTKMAGGQSNLVVDGFDHLDKE